MNQFCFKRGGARELQLFPHVVEIGFKKNTSIQLESFTESIAEYLQVYYFVDGKFEWNIDGHSATIFPTDVVFVLPGQKIGGTRQCLDIGTLAWLYLDVEQLEDGKIVPGDWSSLTGSESQVMGAIMAMNKSAHLSLLNEVGHLFRRLHNELMNQEIGYRTRVNQLLDELLILLTRQLSKQGNSGRDFSKKFLQLEYLLRQDLSHQWTVEEMAATVGMGTTLFNEQVKNYSGFTPLTYLINIRISEAIKLLKKPDLNVTDIALDTGFYSSQHFSTTFKKLTGYTPTEFRKKNLKGD